MAAGWTVILEEGRAAASDARGGKALLYYQRQIDNLASDLGLTALSTFFSRDPRAIADYLRDQGVEPDMDELPDEEWFEPEDGLATIRGLLAALRDDPSAAPEPTKIIADLEGIERALESAGGVRFHLGRELAKLSERADDH